MNQEVMNELVNMSQEIIKLKDQNWELLEALKAICDEQDERQGYASHETYDKARAAISKAEGVDQ